MYKNIIVLISVVLFAFSLSAQESVNENISVFKYEHKGVSEAVISFLPPELSFENITINDTSFVKVSAEGFMKSYNSGYPDMPSVTKLIAIPHGVELELKVKNRLRKKLLTKTHQLDNYMLPATNSLSKSNSNNQLNRINDSVYSAKEYIGKPVTELEKVGQFNDFDIYQLTYNPVNYNPSTGKIKTDNGVNAVLSAKGSNSTEGILLIDDISGVKGSSANLSKKYIIVSPLNYKDTLQDFVVWKKQMGFNVEEVYVGETISSNSKDTIKAYLKNVYESPEGLGYLLLIGDVDQIPSWPGTGHVTDLYYGEFTGDYFPEIQYGRMSVNTPEELGNIIHKNLVVQKGNQSDMAYQDTHIYVAGVDASYASVYCNGPVNYFLDYYANANNGITSEYYLYGSGSPVVSNARGAKAAILDDINNGAGIVYYTAHCVTSGWLNPSLTISDINGTTTNGKYPLYIGNCCDSYMFNTISFGELVVKAKEKGAVAYIGTTDESYWEEDYHWGVGTVSNYTTHPTYNQSGLGTWDSWFHLNGESESKWTRTAFDFIWYGNMAVQASTSARKKYYWEVYNLSGDPSFIVRRKNYDIVSAVYESNLLVGQSILTVNTIENAVATLTVNNNVVATGTADASGMVSLSFDPLGQVCDNCAEIVVTHPYYLPSINSVEIIPPDGSYIVTSGYVFKNTAGHIITEAKYGDTVLLTIDLNNIGNASNDTAIVMLQDNDMLNYISDSIMIKDIGAASTKSINSLSFVIKNDVPDNYDLNILSVVKFDNGRESKYNLPLQVNAPHIEAKLAAVDLPEGSGNGDGVIDPSELVTLSIAIGNKGGAGVENVRLVLYMNDTSLITLVSDTVLIGGIQSVEKDTVGYDIIAANDFISGTQTTITYKIISGENNQYEFTGLLTVYLGEEPEIYMKDTIVTVSSALFYDSGGNQANYGSSESYTTTFKPVNPDNGLIVEFYSVDIEPNGSSCYDRMYVYDGSVVATDLITSFCNNDAPDVLMSQNPDGSLTFRFISDRSDTRAGWEAYIYSSEKHSVTFAVSDGIENLENAVVNLNNKSDNTDAEGKVVFENVTGLSTKDISITCEGYEPFSMELDEFYSDTVITIIMNPYPDICLSVVNNQTPVVNARVEYADRTGYTDELGEVTFNKLKPGSYDYSISHYSIFDVTGTYSFLTDEGCLDIEVEKRKAQCTFEITNGDSVLSSAFLELAGVIKETNSSGIVMFDSVPFGTASVSVNKVGYITVNEQVLVNAENESYSIELDNGESKYNVTFNLQGSDTVPMNRIFVHLGDVALFSSSSVVVVTDIVPENDISYSIHADGYKAYYGTVSVLDRNISVSVTLTPVEVGVLSISANSEFSISPNPLKQGEDIFISSPVNIEHMNVYSISGELIKAIDEVPGNKEFNLSGLQSGVYIVELYSEGSVHFERLVVE